MATNQVTYYLDPTLVAARSAEVPLADFTGGLNRGGSCAVGIGINTGNPNPSEQDWPRPATSEIQTSQHIGVDPTNIFTIDETFAEDEAVVSFVEAAGTVVADATIATVSGTDIVNRTGQTLSAGDWAWGVGDT